MAINVEVEKTNNESNASLIRRFTKRTQGAGILPRVRSIRYASRTLSRYKRKKATLKVLRRKAEVTELIKMGKMSETPRR